MTLRVVLASEGNDAFLLEGESDDDAFLYDRNAQRLIKLVEPATLVRRGFWRDFEGDAEKILSEVKWLEVERSD